jgi:hypothetical protein
VLFTANFYVIEEESYERRTQDIGILLCQCLDSQYQLTPGELLLCAKRRGDCVTSLR